MIFEKKLCNKSLLIKLTLSSENKFHGRKDYFTKCYCIRSELTAFGDKSRWLEAVTIVPSCKCQGS